MHRLVGLEEFNSPSGIHAHLFIATMLSVPLDTCTDTCYSELLQVDREEGFGTRHGSAFTLFVSKFANQQARLKARLSIGVSSI